MTEPLKPLTPEQRKDYEAYAIAMGYSDPKNMSDERLRGIMNYMANECAKYGCD